MEIRKAKLNDLNECQKISKTPELYLDYYGRRPDKAYLKEFLGPLFLVAIENKKIIGYIVGEKNKAKIVSINIIVVDKLQRGKGIGKLLLNEFILIAKKLKFKDLYLLAPKWNSKTLEFYKKAGFTEMKYYSYFTKEI